MLELGFVHFGNVFLLESSNVVFVLLWIGLHWIALVCLGLRWTALDYMGPRWIAVQLCTNLI